MSRILSQIVLIVFLVSLLPAANVAQPVSGSTPAMPIVAQTGPQLMPPHPDLLARYKRGEVGLPEFITNPAIAVQKGIDTPPLQLATFSNQIIKILAVGVDFKDKPHTVSASIFDNLIFDNIYGIQSVRRYFSLVISGGKYIDSSNKPGAAGWITAPQNYSEYIDSDYCTDGGYPNNCPKLAEDIFDKLDSTIDFSLYDNDHDGIADPIILIHAGSGAEYTGSDNDIWSHSWTIENPRTYDGVIVSKYIIVPEYWVNVSADDTDMTIGVFCHEIGHGFLNWPDLYDRDLSSSGVGDWSLMGTGAWNGLNRLGESPSRPDVWTRSQTIGNSPTLISAGSVVPFHYQHTNGYKIQPPGYGPGEYFLIEYRDNWIPEVDENIPGSGLLIWHVDEAMKNNNLLNDNECVTEPHSSCPGLHPLLALEQADGLHELELAINNGNAGDVFPGLLDVLSWTFSTIPGTSSYYSTQDQCVSMTNIHQTMTDEISAYVIPFCETTPGNFGKLKPYDGEEIMAPLLEWEVSSLAGWYEYCYDTTDDNSCTNWISTKYHIYLSSDVGLSTYGVPLGTLEPGKTYYWQVRAVNSAGFVYANGSPDSFWQFTVSGVTSSNLEVTNVTDSSITVSWVSSGATISKVDYGLHGAKKVAAYDIRGQNAVSSTHYVTINGLTPNTVYELFVNTHGVMRTNYDTLTVTTGSTLPSPGVDMISGRVYKMDGITPGDGALVIFALNDNDLLGQLGKSASLSALADANGEWSFNLAQARTSSLTAYFSYSPAGDRLSFFVLGDPEKSTAIQVDTADDSHLPDLILSPCASLAVVSDPLSGGSATVNTPGNCPFFQNLYIDGSEIQVSARANLFFAFSDWNGAATGKSNPFFFNVHGSALLTANFRRTDLFKSFLALIPRMGPVNGHWKNNPFWMEFWVTPDRQSVKNFSIHIAVSGKGCGNFKITQTNLLPISDNTFIFTGPFYASGTFTGPDKASGSVGLNYYLIEGCGFVSGGPFGWNAIWVDSLQGMPEIWLEGIVIAPENSEEKQIDPSVTIERINFQ